MIRITGSRRTPPTPMRRGLSWIVGTIAVCLLHGGCGGEDPAPPDPPDVAPSGDTGASTHPTGSTGDTAASTDPGTGNLPSSATRWYGRDRVDLAGWSIDLAEVLADHPGEEILVGTPSTFLEQPVGYDGDAGAYLLLANAPAGVLDDVARTFFVPSHNGDYWGYGIAGLGDVTGDGEPDVMVGGAVGGSPYLAMPIYSGPGAGDIAFDQAAAWWFEVPQSGTPLSLDGARPCGDVDGDTQVDLCAGTIRSSFYPSEVSQAIVVLGPVIGGVGHEDVSIWLQAPPDEHVIGLPLAAGDFDGDGSGDLLLGALKRDGYNGGVYLATGLRPGVVPLADGPLWTGEAGGGQAGQTVAAGGDLDGDGRVDGFVGAPQLNVRTGRGYVVVDAAGGPLAAAWATFDGGSTLDWLAMAAALGDLDGDGADDLAIGIPRDVYFGFDRPGRVAVFAGPIGPGQHTEADAAAVWTARDVADSFGSEIDIGDVDADGRGDLLVGAPYDGSRVEYGGSVVLLLGGGL